MARLSFALFTVFFGAAAGCGGEVDPGPAVETTGQEVLSATAPAYVREPSADLVAGRTVEVDHRMGAVEQVTRLDRTTLERLRTTNATRVQLREEPRGALDVAPR
jgi:hypothetical protein